MICSAVCTMRVYVAIETHPRTIVLSKLLVPHNCTYNTYFTNFTINGKAGIVDNNDYNYFH